MKGRFRKGKGKRQVPSGIPQSSRPRILQGPSLLSPTLAQALWYTMYALVAIVVGSAAAICTHYGTEIGHAIFGGSMAVGAVISTISQLVLSLLLAALTVTGRMLCLNCWALWCNMYAWGSSVMTSAIAVCSHCRPEVGQAVVGGFTAVSGVPFVISVCVLSMMLAGATVTGWRLCLNCWGFVWTGSRLLQSTCRMCRTCFFLENLPTVHLDKAVWVCMYGLGHIVVGFAIAVCTHHGAKIDQANFGVLMATGVVASAMSMLVLPLLLAAVIVTGWRLCMNCWVSWVRMYVLGFIVVGSAMAICTHCGAEGGRAAVGGWMAGGLAPSAFLGGVLSILLVACAVTGGMPCMKYQGVWTASRLWRSACRRAECTPDAPLDDLPTAHLQKPLEQHQDDDDDHGDAGKAKYAKHISNALQFSAESAPSATSWSGKADPTLRPPAPQEQHGNSVPAELSSGNAEPIEQRVASSDHKPQKSHKRSEKKGQSNGGEGKGGVRKNEDFPHGKTATESTNQHPELDDGGAGKHKVSKDSHDAQQLPSDSVPAATSRSGPADPSLTTPPPAQVQHRDSAPAELSSGTAEPTEQQPAASSNDKIQGKTKCQRRREKKKQAASQANDAQASNKSISKGPQTPPETPPTRAKITPAHSPDSAVMDKAADRPASNDEQTGEWVQDRASKRKAQQAKRGLASNTDTQPPNTKNGFNTAGNSTGSASTRKKAHTNSLLRQAVRSSTVRPHMTKSANVTANSHPKPMSGKTYSSAMGRTLGVSTDVVVPLVGHKAPIKGLEQLSKLPSGASAFTAFRSVRGDGDCAFRAIVVAMLEQAFLGTTKVRKTLLSSLTLSYILLPPGYRTQDVELGHNTFKVNSQHDKTKVDSHAMQGLLQTMLEGKSKLHLTHVLQSCFNETTCNGMVSLLRAIAADGFRKSPGRWLTAVQLATECDSVDMTFMCDVFVRPLACKHRDDLWEQRWPDHPHLQVLAECLGLNFMVHNTQTKYFVTGFGDCADHNPVFHLLHTGCHYQLLYK